MRAPKGMVDPRQCASRGSQPCSRISHHKPKQGRQGSSDEDRVRGNAIRLSPRWALAFRANSPPSPQPEPHYAPKKKKKKNCYSDIIGLKEYPVQYALQEWRVFCVFLGGCSTKDKNVWGQQRKFICRSRPPYCGIFNYIYLIMAVSWWIQKRHFGPPLLFFVFSSSLLLEWL